MFITFIRSNRGLRISFNVDREVDADNFTCILEFDALKMVVSKSSPKINSRGMIHFPSLRFMLPRSFTMLGCFVFLHRRDRGHGGKMNKYVSK